jgi:Domain of unknown function (DUF4157)
VSSRREADVDREAAQTPASPSFAKAARPLERVVAATGNRCFRQVVARMQDGEGILPDGVVHPDVEAAIRASRGRGRPLEDGMRGALEDRLGAGLDDVRIHADEQAASLARAVSARAFTVGSDIYFGRNELQAHGGQPSELMTHEVTHVLQQCGAALTGPLTVSQPGDPAEVEAEAVARDAAG